MSENLAAHVNDQVAAARRDAALTLTRAAGADDGVLAADGTDLLGRVLKAKHEPREIRACLHVNAAPTQVAWIFPGAHGLFLECFACHASPEEGPHWEDRRTWICSRVCDTCNGRFDPEAAIMASQVSEFPVPDGRGVVVAIVEAVVCDRCAAILRPAMDL